MSLDDSTTFSVPVWDIDDQLSDELLDMTIREVWIWCPTTTGTPHWRSNFMLHHSESAAGKKASLSLDMYQPIAINRADASLVANGAVNDAATETNLVGSLRILGRNDERISIRPGIVVKMPFLRDCSARALLDFVRSEASTGTCSARVEAAVSTGTCASTKNLLGLGT